MKKKVPVTALSALIASAALVAAGSVSALPEDGSGKMIPKQGSGWSMRDTAKILTSAKPGRNNTERCYGVVLKGKNDCSTYSGTHKHSCGGQAKQDRDSHEWGYVLKGNCKRLGGSLKSGGKG